MIVTPPRALKLLIWSPEKTKFSHSQTKLFCSGGASIKAEKQKTPVSCLHGAISDASCTTANAKRAPVSSETEVFWIQVSQCWSRTAAVSLPAWVDEQRRVEECCLCCSPSSTCQPHPRPKRTQLWLWLFFCITEVSGCRSDIITTAPPSDLA